MYATMTASSRFKIYAAAALAALLMTLLAVTLAAGPAQATATTTVAPSGDDNSIPQQQGAATTPTPPRHATPEACPGETGNTNSLKSVVDSGHYALFDVWWNPEEKELTNSVCPPSVTHVPGEDDGIGNVTPASDDRSPSSINITAEPPTIIHIPSSTRVNLNDSDTPYTQTKYPEVWDADGKENRPNAEGTPVPGKGDRIVWVLPACPPAGDPSEVGLCLSFTAALLKQADWVKADGTANGKVEYLIDHVHQTDIDRQDPRYVLAYDVPATDAPGPFKAIWDTSNADRNAMGVAPEEYERPMWFFTDRGTYEFQVHIKGHPNPNTIRHDGLKRFSQDKSVTSDVREYILHVGAEADLSSTMAVTPQNPSPGNNVTIEITASNAGPDTAPEVKVDVTLPEGLTYSSHETATGTYADGVWSIGKLAVTNDDNDVTSDDSPTLTITATVDAETHGKELTAKAALSATETVKITETVKNEQSGQDEEKEVTYHVPVPDPNSDNNMATGMTTVARNANVAAMFMVARSVRESSAAGTNVGAPVLVKNPEASDTLTFTLSGDGRDNFRVATADGGAQIKVAADSYLNYEDTTAPYDLTLQVSDGKDSNGNVDNSVDDSIPVRVAVDDVSESEGITLTAPSTAVTGERIWLRGSLENNSPAPRGDMEFIWFQRSPNGEIDWRDNSQSNLALNFTHDGSAGVKEYAVIGKYFDRSADVIRTVESAWVEVTWTNPNPE